MDMFTGARDLIVPSNIINELYKNKKVSVSPEKIWDKRLRFKIQNEYVTLISQDNSKQSAIGRVVDTDIVLLQGDTSIDGLRARNKEQIMAMNALMDDSIKMVVLTGKAGTGKTLLTLAAATSKVIDRNLNYDRIILTRPMSWVGKHGLGALPGTSDEKFAPYLENYMTNIDFLLNDNKSAREDFIQQLKMEFIPIQLIRGASWRNSFVLADEVQVLNHMEMLTLGTRLGEGSKLVILGDLGQRDENIAQDKTGLWKIANSPIAQESKLVASVHLVKSERSQLSALVSDIFEAK